MIYRAIGKAMGVDGIDAMDDEAAASATIAAVKQLSKDVGIPADLKASSRTRKCSSCLTALLPTSAAPVIPVTPAWRKSNPCTAI